MHTLTEYAIVISLGVLMFSEKIVVKLEQSKLKKLSLRVYGTCLMITYKEVETCSIQSYLFCLLVEHTCLCFADGLIYLIKST
jgi:hypothetical protein